LTYGKIKPQWAKRQTSVGLFGKQVEASGFFLLYEAIINLSSFCKPSAPLAVGALPLPTAFRTSPADF